MTNTKFPNSGYYITADRWIMIRNLCNRLAACVGLRSKNAQLRSDEHWVRMYFFTPFFIIFPFFFLHEMDNCQGE